MEHEPISLSHDAAAIIGGWHSDPFSYLGPHEENGESVVRAFFPGARGVHVVDSVTGNTIAKLAPVTGDGLFAGPVPHKMPFAYRLAVDWGGETTEIEDPYRFAPWLGELDVYWLGEGTHLNAYDKFGAHVTQMEGIAGIAFAVWAPNATRVSVVGDFNQWDGRRNPMRLRHGCGAWEIFVPGLLPGARYKYEIRTRQGDILLKADPYAFYAERSPGTASIVQGADSYVWNDGDWMAMRADRVARSAPMAIYEVHAGSWRRKVEEGNRYLTYRELAQELVPYVKSMGFSHIEFMPMSEYPFDGSWGYQPTGLFAPTSRFGTPDDFRVFIDVCHQVGLGVIMDWVPAHFPGDAHGLAMFDGTHLYEHADPRQGRHRDWDTLIYNYGRVEVSNFLLNNALFWLDRFHIDGLRVDAVASMLYLDYSRTQDDWIPNEYGGNENLAAIAFLRRLNEVVYGRFPGVVTMAEELTAWPMVSRPTYVGGLGFGYKWNMGWMHDTLTYIAHDPIHRRYYHDRVTFGLLYAFTENFILPLSHDEVVHGKGSLLGKMPGDRWQKFANLRAYLAFMYAHPGKKLLFMGGEFAQEREWNHDTSLDWHLLGEPEHAGMRTLVRDLNRLLSDLPALHEEDCEPQGFEWIDCTDHETSVISFLRRAHNGEDIAVAVCNFTPVLRQAYRIGVPQGGAYREVFNSDASLYGGSNAGNGGFVQAEAVPCHGRPFSLSLNLPPLATLILAPHRG